MSNEELIALLKKNPIGIGCGVLSLALFGGWYYRSGDVPTTEETLAQKQAEGERYALNLTNATQLQEQFEALVAANKEIETRLVHANRPGPNIQYLYKLESETGVKLTDPRPAAPRQVKKDAPKTAFIPVGFNLTLNGDLSQVLNYLRRLESGAHYCRVLGITCSVPPVRSLSLNVSISLEFLGLP